MKGLNIGKATGNYFFTVVLIFALATMLGYYFLIYVPDHEENIHEKNFRELNQISQNLRTRANSLITNAKNVISDDSALAHITFALSNYENEDNANNTTVLSRLKDELNREVSKFNENLTFTELNFRFETLDHEESDEHDVEVHTNTPRASTILYSDELDLSKKVKCIIGECGNNPNINQIHDCIKCVNSHSKGVPCHNTHEATFLEYKIEIDAEQLLGSLLHFDQFEHFILTTKDWVIYESHPSGSLVFEQAIDSLVKGTNQVQTTHLKQLKINGKDYDTYVRPIFISKKQHWNLVGFINSDDIRAEKLSISPKLSLILFLVSIIVVLALPVIKLRFINNHEKLDTRDITFAYFSILCLVVLSTVLSKTAYEYYKFQLEEKQRIATISKGINSEFNGELKEITSFLDQFEVAYKTLDDERFNPLSETEQSVLAAHKSHFEKYPYLEDFFVLSESGFQEKKWTIKRHRTPKFNVKNRDYFKKLMVGAGFDLEHEIGKHGDYYLQSIVSYNTGQQLSIITKKPESSNNVIGLTTKLYSLYNTILPYGYQYAVINDDGLVQFHSDSEKNLQENFYDEVSEPQTVQNLINSGNMTFFTSDYHGKRSTLLIRELIDNHYLIVISDKEIMYGIFSRILRDSIAAPFLIILILFVVITLFAKFTVFPVSYSFIFRPTSKTSHLFSIRRKEISLNTILWITLVLFVSIIIPLIIFQSSLNREKSTLDLLRKQESVYSLSDKNDAINDYTIRISENLSSAQDIFITNKHITQRKNSGNYLLNLKESHHPSGLWPVNYINLSLPVNDFDYRMNNTFMARDQIINQLAATDSYQSLVNQQTSAERSIDTSLPLTWILFVLLVIYQILVIFVIYGVFSFAIRRFFEANIDSPGNWYFNDVSKNKLFIVTLSLKEHFKDKNPVEWSFFKEKNNSSEGLLAGELVIKNFPHTVEELTAEDVRLFHELAFSDQKVTVICKQTPLLLAKEVTESEPGFDDEDFLEALANFDTFYIPIGDDDIADAKKNALKARSRYQKLLSVLSKNEQYLIYDLAEDGVINVRNHEMINSLFKKGIIVPSGKHSEKEKRNIQEEIANISVITDPQFFDDDLNPKTKHNLSFRNFVLDRFDAKFIESLKLVNQEKSTWQKIRVPLIIVFVGLFIFIVFTQEAYLAQIIGILSSLLTVLGLFSKFTNTFSSFKGSNNEQPA